MLRFVLFLLVLLLGVPQPGTAQTAPGPEEALPAGFRRGVNILGYDPLWDDPAHARFHPELFARIREGGFDHVRINLQTFAHMDAQDHLDPRWLETLDGVVRAASAAGLGVILDEHDFAPCGADPGLCRTQLSAFWEQVAPRFADAPATVLFEILNEPNSGLTPEAWNALFPEILTVIRRTNPTRTVIIGPGDYDSFRDLDRLVLPEADRHLVVTFHYYEPFLFTHQGATWTVPSREHDVGYGWGSAEDRAQLVRDFDTVAAWAGAHRRPVLLGEFGAYEAGDLAARVAWTDAVARAAEAHGFAWCAWQFEGSFAIFDIARDAWIAPIHDALVPAPGAP